MEVDATKIYFDSEHLDWLGDHCGGWQFGEQGLLAAISHVIGGVGRATEIGAGDGESLPLTVEPFYAADVPCILYEADEERRIKLRHQYPDATIRGEYKLSGMFKPIKNELVVIDIDGLDSHAMVGELTRNPKIAILMVEHFDLCNKLRPQCTDPVPHWLLGQKLEGGFTIQDTANSLLEIANNYGLQRIGVSRVNSIFVRSDLYPLLCKPVPVECSLAGI